MVSLLNSIPSIVNLLAITMLLLMLFGIKGVNFFAGKMSYCNKENMPEKSIKTFADVKGCDEAKAELQEIVEYLKNPGKFTRLGGKLPKVRSPRTDSPWTYTVGPSKLWKRVN